MFGSLFAIFNLTKLGKFPLNKKYLLVFYVKILRMAHEAATVQSESCH